MTDTIPARPKRCAVLLVAFGSRGDVQPLVTVLEALCIKCQPDRLASLGLITHQQHQTWLGDWLAARSHTHRFPIDLHFVSTPVIEPPSSPVRAYLPSQSAIPPHTFDIVILLPTHTTGTPRRSPDTRSCHTTMQSRPPPSARMHQRHVFLS